MKDKSGIEIKPGDLVAYAVRDGNIAELKIALVLDASSERIKVRAQSAKASSYLSISDRVVVIDSESVSDDGPVSFEPVPEDTGPELVYGPFEYLVEGRYRDAEGRFTNWTNLAGYNNKNGGTFRKIGNIKAAITDHRYYWTHKPDVQFRVQRRQQVSLPWEEFDLNGK